MKCLKALIIQHPKLLQAIYGSSAGPNREGCPNKEEIHGTLIDVGAAVDPVVVESHPILAQDLINQRRVVGK